MGLFNKKAAPQSPAMKYHTARSNLLLVVAFTAINLVLLVLESDMYFVFSASVPLFLVALGGELAAMLSTEAPYIIGIVAAVAVIGLYLLCYFLSKKQAGWMIVALVLFSIDCLFLLLSFSTDMIIDLLFHAWVMYYLIIGVANGSKKDEQPELPAEPFPMEASQPVMTVNGVPVEENFSQIDGE